ncbi:fumarylacetoacetate hydrolase family protein [Pseudomonas sp. DWP1b1]|uniref:fumarylacetoacetate hydrolase family protein n=1 Tax=unclassified Pseudomonas TaxID=196821 RepID=UPI003CF49075
MNYVFEPQPATALFVQGRDLCFAVRRVYCVGRNYAAHAREMGFDPDRERPFFFCKPGDAVVPVAAGATLELEYPSQTNDYHYEVELVVAIGRAGRNIPADQAAGYVWGYAVGLDMTRRDLQLGLRKAGRPWEAGKSFDRSAPIGPLLPVTEGQPGGPLWLQVNGLDRQRSSLDRLIWSVPEIISELSRFFELRPGDLIMTGTPEGVGPVLAGDLMHAGIEGVGELHVQVI